MEEHMTNQAVIGERFLIARRRKALSQKELAKLAKVGVLTISRIERGEFQDMPRPATVRGIATALDVSPGWLLFGDEMGKAPARSNLAGAQTPDTGSHPVEDITILLEAA